MKHVIGLLLYALITLTLLPSSVMAGKSMSVTFLNPGAKGDVFFDMMTSFMQAAANDLDIDLEVIYCDRDHFNMQEKGRELLQRDHLPDYLILINEKNAGVELLEESSNLGIKVALINEGLLPVDARRLGHPGALLKNWVLEVLPDDRQAGRLLAEALISEAFERGLGDNSGRVHLVGVAGNYQTGSSTSRVKGLREAVLDDDRVVLHQTAPAYWEEGRAREVVERLLLRYPEVSIVWSASDLMARGAFTAFSEQDREVITGGIDWAVFSLPMVERGDFAATVGGHFMDGAWALVMLYDMHHGLSLPRVSYQSRFSLITSDNVGPYLRHFGENNWDRIDFRRFSRKENPEMDEYPFGLYEVLQQMKGRESDEDTG